MRNVMKRVVAVTLLMAMTLASLMLPENNHEVSASVPMIYYSEVWDGTGSAVIVVDQISSDRFFNLTYQNEEVDSTNYSVDEQEGSTVITFKQEYLQGLDLQNVGNHFMAKFAGKEASCFRRYILIEGQNKIVIDRQLNAGVSKLTLKKSLSEEVDVDESNYTVKTTEESIIITFKEDYLKTLTGDSDFCIYGVQDRLVWLEVVTDEVSDVPQTTEPPTSCITQPPLTDCVKPAPSESALPDSDHPVTQEAVKAYLLGNINEDSEVTLEDASEILKYALMIKKPKFIYQKFSADVNGDGTVALEDASAVLKMALKIEETIVVETVSNEENSTTAFVEEADINEIGPGFIKMLTSEDELRSLLAECSNEKAEEILEKYAGLFEEFNVLATCVRVYYNDLSEIKYYTTINGNHILTQIIKNEVCATENGYICYMFTCVDKSLVNAQLSLDSGDLSIWKEIPIIEDSGVFITCGMGKFDLQAIKEGTDYAFRGTVVDRKQYDVSWYNDNGEQRGPFTKSVIEVRIDEEYYGTSPVTGDTIKIYYPMPLDADKDGNFWIRDGAEYVFETKAFDEEFIEERNQNPDDKYEHEKHADCYISDTCYDVMAVEDGNVIFYKDYFEGNEAVTGKLLSEESLSTDKMTSEYILKNFFAVLKLQDFDEVFPNVFN